MAYEIKIIGEQNPIVLTNDQGLKVITMYEDRLVPKDTKINLGDVIRTNKGQIRSIRKVEDSASGNSKINKVVVDVNKLDRDIYLSWKVKTPEEKAKRLEMFVQCYRAIHNKMPSEEVLADLKEDLVIFFSKNPNRTYPDPPIYIKHFGVGADKLVIDKFRFSMLKLLEQVIVNDMLTAKTI
jgi:hypothetical protein